MSNKQSVVVIEDDQNMGNAVKQAFEAAGFEVTWSLSGKDGLEQAIKVQPTVILLDVIIPDMTGWDVLLELQNNPKTKDIPVVVDTNLDSSEREMEFLHQGAKAFLVKTDYDPDSIVKKVQEILKAQ